MVKVEFLNPRHDLAPSDIKEIFRIMYGKLLVLTITEIDEKFYMFEVDRKYDPTGKPATIKSSKFSSEILMNLMWLTRRYVK